MAREERDAVEHTNQEVVRVMASEFHLSDDERAQLLPRGGQTVLANRLAWAKAHFKRAGLLEATGRGVYRIAERGREVNGRSPDRIDLKYLDQFPGHREFRTSPRRSSRCDGLWWFTAGCRSSNWARR